jgi:hypothetical protein
MIALRGLAILAGVAILAAVAHVNIVTTGGYGTPFSYIAISVGAGVVVASTVIGAIMGTVGRKRLVAAIICAIIAGEVFNFLATAERLIKGREAEQAPLRGALEARAKAAKRVDAAKRAVDRAPTTSRRLEDANRAKAEADKAVVDKSAERSCRENCRQLLQAQVNAAAAEVKDAQVALDGVKQKAEGELAAARAAFASLKAPDSPTPLADRTGIPAWIIDLVQSAVGSISANGLACCLLVFGAHSPQRRQAVVAKEEVQLPQLPPAPLKANEVPRQPKLLSPRDLAARFALERLNPNGDGAELTAIRREYRAWSTTRPERHAEIDVSRALADLFADAGITVAEQDGRLVVLGVSLKEPKAPPWLATH